MIYPDNFEQKIGFDRVRGQVSRLCSTEEGREKLNGEAFSTSVLEIEQRIGLCEELRLALMMEGDFPAGDYVDTRMMLAKVDVMGAFLSVEEVLRLRLALVMVRDIVNFFKSKGDESYPRLKALCAEVSGFPQLVNHIDSLIDRFGNIKDSASPELYDIRRSLREKQGLAAKRLQAVLAAAQREGIVDADASVSIRDGRSVIPVSAANKRKLKGFVQDESATGKTVFIEPVEVVEINNELRELEYREKREIVRILTVFTDTIRPDIEGIKESGDYLTTMDMLHAKARWAIDNECVKPIMSVDGTLELRTARHPLLAQALRRENKKVVPLDMRLTREKFILVISGPNAGGKSVCLKTVGLLQYMYQCGWLVPVAENSEFPVFDGIFIDIGDEQSIDNDLSTYSSHLLNMKNLMAHATDRSLALIDEFGTGTEPVIGGAIAEAILERLEQRGTYGVITTHYSNIKYFASNAPGVVNGAMMFDVQHIQPLFKLEMGVPGSSFAIEIARKIGLPDEIIRSAGEKAGTDRVNLEKQLKEIARDKRYWEHKRERIRIADRRIEEMEAKYADQLAAIKSERSAILKQAKAEAVRLTSEANKQIENTIRTIKESQADREKTRFVRKNLDEFREQLSQEDTVSSQDRINREMEKLRQRQERRAERKGDARETKRVEPKEPEIREVAVGAKVRIKGQDALGEVMSMKGKKVTVGFGQILTTVDSDRLEVVSNSEYKRQTRHTMPAMKVDVDISKRKLTFKQNIDVRGMRAVEALDAVQDFVDDAVMVGVSEVRILHGKGTGALKEEIRRYLRSVDMVAGAEDEHVEMGGSGITVVKLRV